MALGSSAPEILLNVLEIFGQGFKAGSLGPSTIVGSAAFNLLIIIAVCVVFIPEGETRKIDQMGVFNVTAFFSVFAYIWLLIILLWISPNVVTLAEAIITFAFFVILIGIAYLADKGYFCKIGTASEVIVDVEGQDGDHKFIQSVKQKYGREMSDEQAKMIANYEARAANQPKTRAYWRVNATRSMVGGKRVKTTQVKYL